MWVVPQPSVFRGAANNSLLSLFPLPQLAGQEVLQGGWKLALITLHPCSTHNY